MRPVEISAKGASNNRQGCRGPFLGAVALLVAAIFGAIGIMSIGSDPAQGIRELVVASVAGVVFGRAWIADRRRREVERRTIHRRPAAAGDQAVHRYADGRSRAGDPMAIAVRTFLDDPDRLRYLDIEGTGSMRLHFALLSTDPTVLRGEATGLSRLDPGDHPGPDAQFGLIALGWAAPTPPSREDFVAEWSLPVDLARLGAFILSTARIYNVDPTLLRPRFASQPSVTFALEPNVLREQTDTMSVGAPGRQYLRTVFDSWSRHPAVKWLWWSILFVVVVAGPDGLDGFVHSLPGWLPSGALGIVFLLTGVRYVLRFLKTSDPFSVTDREGPDPRTDYEAHMWWGIFGAVGVLAGIAFLVFALGEFG